MTEAPLPHLTGAKPKPEKTDKKPQWNVMLLALASLLACISVYAFYQSGAMSRGGSASPLVVLVPVCIMILYQGIVTISRLSKAKKENIRE